MKTRHDKDTKRTRFKQTRHLRNIHTNCCGDIAKIVVQSSHDWTGEALPSYLRTTPEITLMRHSILPNKPMSVHKHPAICAAYVLEGDLTLIKPDGTEKTFHKGDGFLEMVDKWHHGENRGDVPVELIMFYTSSKHLPLSVLHDKLID